MMDDRPDDVVARRDELLELLYWIEGEGFGGAATLSAIVRFLAHPEDQTRLALQELIACGDVAHDAASDEYRLTATGRREAARRFAETFAPMLSQGHGECNDPNCDCHSDPLNAAECHAARKH